MQLASERREVRTSKYNLLPPTSVGAQEKRDVNITPSCCYTGTDREKAAKVSASKTSSRCQPFDLMNNFSDSIVGGLNLRGLHIAGTTKTCRGKASALSIYSGKASEDM
eukprot:5277078-Pyramimonas_sp.AAC.1